MIGLADGGLRASVNPTGSEGKLLGELDHRLAIPWSERERLRQPVEVRFRVVPMENAIEFFQSGELFRGRDHRKLLIDFDMDALSTHSPRSLQLSDRYFSGEELTFLSRARWGLKWDLMAPFEHALGERGPAKIVNPSGSQEMGFPDTCSRCKRLGDLVGDFSLTRESKQTPFDALAEFVVEHANITDAREAKIVADIMAEAVQMPFHVSDARALDILERFFEVAFRALPVTPEAVTTVRSPFFSPKGSVGQQECLLLRIIRKLWPDVEPIRMGDHVVAWHQSCEGNGFSEWSHRAVGSFKKSKSSDERWSLAVPERVIEEFSVAVGDIGAEKKTGVVATFSNTNTGEVELAWKGPKGEVYLTQLAPGQIEKQRTAVGHTFVARCAGQGPSPSSDLEFTATEDESQLVALASLNCKRAEL